MASLISDHRYVKIHWRHCIPCIHVCYERDNTKSLKKINAVFDLTVSAIFISSLLSAPHQQIASQTHITQRLTTGKTLFLCELDVSVELLFRILSHAPGARELFFNRAAKVKIKFNRVTWYVDFHPTPWNRADCLHNMKGRDIDANDKHTC